MCDLYFLLEKLKICHHKTDLCPAKFRCWKSNFQYLRRWLYAEKGPLKKCLRKPGMVLYVRTASTVEVGGRKTVVQGQVNHTWACLKSTRSNLVKTVLIRTGLCVLPHGKRPEHRHAEGRTCKHMARKWPFLRREPSKKLSMITLISGLGACGRAHLHYVCQLMCAVLLWQPEKANMIMYMQNNWCGWKEWFRNISPCLARGSVCAFTSSLACGCGRQLTMGPEVLLSWEPFAFIKKRKKKKKIK